MNPIQVLDAARRELRQTLRGLARSPWFTAAAVLTLAVGLGVNAALFSVVDALLLRALPYPEPGRLAVVSTTYRSPDGESSQWSQTGRTWEVLRDGVRGTEVAVFSGWAGGVNLAAGGEAAHVGQQRVGAGFFRVLGVEPVRGRGFLSTEDLPGGPRVVILSHELWQRAFAGDPAVLGRDVLLKGEPSTVVGIMPPGFRSTSEADLWTPLRASTEGEGQGTNYGILVRPRRGVTLQGAADEVAAVAGRAWEAERGGGRVSASFGLLGLQDALTEGIERPLLILWGVAGLVLLVVCANLASLALARAGRRRRELAARVALGSGRGGVVRLVLLESLALAVAGGALGLVLGRLAQAAVAADGAALGLDRAAGLDPRVVALTAALSGVAGLAFGAGPALGAARGDLRRALAAGGAGAVAAGAGGWPRRLLVAGEVAVGVLLVAFAGILTRSFLELRGLDPGFEVDGVVAGSVSLEDARWDTREEVVRLFGEGLRRLRATPGVEAAAVSLGLPFERPLNLGVSLGTGAEPSSAVSTRYVTQGYFETLRVPLLRGRALTAADRAGAPRVAVVNRAFVARHLADARGGAVGATIGIAGEDRQIVGVAGDELVDPSGLGGAAPLAAQPMVFLPVGQLGDDTIALVHTWFRPSFMMRSELPPEAALAAVRDALGAAAPGLPLAELRTLRDVERSALGFQRLLMTLVGGLAAVALLLAALGVYALVANAVVARTRELGIRLALGASRRQALGAVALPAIALAAAGALAGVGLALLGSRLVASLVFEVAAADPLSLAGGTLLLLAAAAAASLLPGLRVLRLDPARTLREE